MDLHPFVPAALGPSFTRSSANAISENGTITGSAEFYDANANVYGSYAVLWTPVPEPSSSAPYSLRPGHSIRFTFAAETIRSVLI